MGRRIAKGNIGINQVYTDQFLSDYAFGILGNEDGEYVSGRFAPLTPVPKPSGKYRIFDSASRAQFETAKALVRAPHEEVSTSDFDWSEDNYNCEEYAHGTHIAPEEVGAADQRALFEMAKTKYVLQVIRQKHEIAFAAKFFVTGVWGATAGSTDVSFGGASQPVVFNDFVNSDPIGLIMKAAEDMRKAGGRWPNVLLIGPAVRRAFANHPQIKNVIGVTSERIVTMDLVARAFGLERIVVAGATKTTSVDAAATAAFDFIYGRSMLLAYVAPNGQPDGLDASACRIFSYNETAAGPTGDLLVPIQRIPRPLNGDERIQGKMNWGHKVTGPQLGTFFNGAVESTF